MSGFVLLVSVGLASRAGGSLCLAGPTGRRACTVGGLAPRVGRVCLRDDVCVSIADDRRALRLARQSHRHAFTLPSRGIAFAFAARYSVRKLQLVRSIACGRAGPVALRLGLVLCEVAAAAVCAPSPSRPAPGCRAVRAATGVCSVRVAACWAAS